VLGFVYRELKQSLADLEHVAGLLALRPEVADRPGARDLVLTGAAVRFDRVGFAYRPARPVLQEVSFTIPPGHTLAVVGSSGAGKSTLVRLLFRFYDVDRGAITIDGQDLRDVTQTSLRAAIGLVPQDTVLFNDTIGANIAYGRPGAEQAAIEAAACAAQIHDFIANLPDQYDTLVGERGLKLSGGEKQRVAIARMVLKDPPILVFDEATSALDSRTERMIQAALRRLSSGRTTLIIAHRLSTVVDADRILVLEHGRVIEEGRHQQLLAHHGTYAQMWARQQEAPAA
jgi:ABC-type transport system involved in Fe-S cluster assembly fused permease/ATPase subunit